MISEAKYTAKKDLVTVAIKAQPRGNQYPKLTTGREMDDAMSLDYEGRWVLSKMKLKCAANDSGEAPGSNGSWVSAVHPTAGDDVVQHQRIA